MVVLSFFLAIFARFYFRRKADAIQIDFSKMIENRPAKVGVINGTGSNESLQNHDELDKEEEEVEEPVDAPDVKPIPV